MRIRVDADRCVVHRRLRQEAGFGLLELLMAMTILNVGILAVVAAFNSGIVALRRSGSISTATVLADKQMELYRALTYGSIALDPTSIPATTYTPPTGSPHATTRTLRRVTVVVRDGRNTSKVLAREMSTFDCSTALPYATGCPTT